MSNRVLNRILNEALFLKSHIALPGPGKVILYQVAIAIGAMTSAFDYIIMSILL